VSRRLWGRLLLGVGSLAAIAISPVFALSYFPAYGGVDESPPGWLADLAPAFIDRGWLGSGDPEGLYAAYGMWYFAFLAITLIGLVVLLRADLGGEWTSGGWAVVVIGLLLATVGTLGDYSGIDALGGLFLLELVGALVIALATVLIGTRLWKAGRRGPAVVGLVGPSSLVLGSALLGHFPSGPLSIFLIGCLVLAIVGATWSLNPDA
jgi:hypothetical protein